MIKPSIGELLDGVAVSLRESVLPEIPAGPTRRQIQVAISIIRRAAQVWDKTGPYLYVDNEDIEETLRQASLRLDRAESKGMLPTLRGFGKGCTRCSIRAAPLTWNIHRRPRSQRVTWNCRRYWPNCK